MLLDVKEIHTYYGTSHVLFGLSLNIQEGQSVALLGRNGAGKSTTLRTTMGLVKPRQGRIIFKGIDITDLPVHRISQVGIGYVPEDRMIFPNLAVWENLDLGIHRERKGRFTLETAFDLFPRLKERSKQQAGMLSGGEQQMLAIARSMLLNPELLLLDEPMEGLGPLVVEEIGNRLRDLKQQQSLAILLCEPNTRFAMNLCNWVYLIEKGAIGYQASIEEFRRNEEIQERYLFVHGSTRSNRP